jgi:cell division protein FtsZ
VSITGATGILINITGGPDLTLFEVNEASTLIQEAAHEDANIIFGSVIDANLVDEVRITVIATGFDKAYEGVIEAPPTSIADVRKRATQIAMPYVRPSTVELKAQAAMRDTPVRTDATPVTAPVRSERPTPPPTPQPSRLPQGMSGIVETELDIPAFLRHPHRSNIE